jgi:lysophospholipase L1-like esterase
MHVIIFGNSISHGNWDKEGGWAARLRKYLYMKTMLSNDDDVYYQVYELGVDASNTTRLLQRFESELKARIYNPVAAEPQSYGEVLIIIAVGTVDAVYWIDKKHHDVEINEFSANIVKLIELAQKYSKKVVFVGMPPVDESRTQPVLWWREISLTNSDLRKYEEETRRVCMERGMHFVPILDKIAKIPGYQAMFSPYVKGGTWGNEDGVHPGARINRIIYTTVKSYLVKNRLIKT